ncbi:MAG: hypothetical protein KC502_13860 [Myxococcales bacterium]|nr:hypothetical protein [Myxococcales bacterium]
MIQPAAGLAVVVLACALLAGCGPSEAISKKPKPTGGAVNSGDAAPDGLSVDTDEDGASMPTSGWRQHTWGGPYNDEAKAVAVAPDGGLWIAGYTESSGAGDWDGIVLRTDDCGQVTWSRTLGGSKKDAFHGIAATEDGGAAAVGVTYSFDGYVEAWVAKLTEAGALQWSHTYGGSGFDQAGGVTETTDNDLVVLAETYNFGPGTPKFHNMMLMRVAGTDGKVVWEQTLGGGKDGDAGFALLRTDGAAGNILVAGATESFGQGRDDIWLSKFNPQGDLLWSLAIGGKEDDESRSIAPDGAGGFLLTGFSRTYTYGKADIFVLRVDGHGQPSWMRRYGNAEKERGYGVFPSAGGFLVAGQTLSYGDGDMDAWVMRLGSAGKPEWARLLRGKFGDEIVAAAATSDGGLAFAGRTASFGAGQKDIWYGRVGADGWAGCNVHTLSDGKVKSGSATPMAVAITPTVAHGAVRRDAAVNIATPTNLNGGPLCTPADCP